MTLILGSGPAQDVLTFRAGQITSTLQSAGMVKRYHASFPSLSYGFDSRYPLQFFPM